MWTARSAANIAPQPATPLTLRPIAVRPQPPAGSCNARGAGLFSLPDPRCTPGAINPAVTQGNIVTTICRQGWTASVRAPQRVTEPEKLASMAAYGDLGPLRGYEYDHLIPLELGGAVNDPRNLWASREQAPNPKDRLEETLNALVCRKDIRLPIAQRLIATNWVMAYRRYVSPGRDEMSTARDDSRRP